MWQLSFLNTGLLILATATVLPLLIWLLAKKKPPRIVFSTIRFIKRTEQEQKTRSQLKNILLLIIRMLIILLIVLAAARPALRLPGKQTGKKHPPTALALILDTSYSMDYTQNSKSLLEQAKTALKEINKLTNDQDVPVLITSDDSWNRINAQLQAGKLPENIINNVKTTWQPLSFDQMYDTAVNKLKDSQLSNREIYMLSDGQAQKLPLKTSLPVSFLSLTQNPGNDSWNNLSCEAAKPLKQLTDKQEVQTISFTITNHGKAVRKDVLVQVDFNGIKAAEKFVTLQPGQKLTDSLPVQIKSSGWQSGYVEVLDEKLTADNRSYFAFPYEQNPTIGVITQRSILPLILQSVLSVYATPKGKVQLIAPDQINLEQLRNFSLLTVYDAGELSPRLRQILSDWSAKGNNVLYVANKELTTGWKSFYFQEFGISLKDYRNDPQPLSFVNQYHSITAMIDAQQLRRTSVADFWTAASGSKTEILLAAGNSPLAVSAQPGILWLFDPASLNSRFFLEAAFPVFAYRCQEFLANTRFDAEQYTTGQNITADTIVLPDGKQLELNGNPYRLSEPGIYYLTKRGEAQTAIAVNPDYRESVYKPLVINGKGNYHILKGKWQDQMFISRLGHDLWKYCLLAVLVLLILEILLVKSEEWKAFQQDQHPVLRDQ